ncbi:hypothetical protein PL9214720050 [Planktothrix tepida PCC 9214]|uniref:Uncharacterized protein n=1 Tax=Planktothrix tepida PCC 9214 TaxID=671072 RepID=A0A1J1LV72_9CYAN|nr:hypothetical protein PL9214720050 [Planktothrix tepida PCC 9214]
MVSWFILFRRIKNLKQGYIEGILIAAGSTLEALLGYRPR